MPDPLIAGGTAGGVGAVLVGLFNRWRDDEKRKVVYDKIDALDKKLDALELLVARDYLQRAEFAEIHRDLIGKMDQVLGELVQIKVALAKKAEIGGAA